MTSHRPVSRQIPLEVAVFSGESALRAQQLGAVRVELNAPGSYSVGGLTPDVGELRRIRASLHIPVRVMIRPRPATADGSPDFIYTPDELYDMASSIHAFKQAGIMNPLLGDGFVLGVVRQIPIDVDDDEGDDDPYANMRIDIDEEACRFLVGVAKPFPCVFHRAFDPIAASKRSVSTAERLAEMGFKALLTAGGVSGPCASEANVDKIDHLCHRMAGRIKIVVGGGLRQHNVDEPARRLAVYDDDTVWFHTAALKLHTSATEELDEYELCQLIERLSMTEPA